jgi:hypothetical protein
MGFEPDPGANVSYSADVTLNSIRDQVAWRLHRRLDYWLSTTAIKEHDLKYTRADGNPQDDTPTYCPLVIQKGTRSVLDLRRVFPFRHCLFASFQFVGL